MSVTVFGIAGLKERDHGLCYGIEAVEVCAAFRVSHQMDLDKSEYVRSES